MAKKVFRVMNEDGRNSYAVSVWDTRDQAEDECRRLQALASSTRTRISYRVQEKYV